MVKPPHVAAYVEFLGLPEPQGQGLSKPTVKQHPRGAADAL